MSICNVVGARPNFMKIAPIIDELRRRQHAQVLVHTGQHYDTQVSAVFFRDLGLPEPDVYLGVGSDSHGRQTARIMTALDEAWEREAPELVVVVGDVNSTVAAALVAAKRGIPVAHIEAGLRSLTVPCRKKSIALSRTISPICSSLPKPAATRTCVAKESRTSASTSSVTA